MSRPRVARLRVPAKINLDLRVLAKRPDGYHELRTVFQTISLADILEIAFTPAAETTVEIAGNVDIPDNLVARAARLALESIGRTGRVAFRLEKRIPMGAGLGGGSADAAAVLLALPVLAGGRLDFAELARLGARLGSDVPFFLLGGTAVGLGRGTEFYPLPDGAARYGVLALPAVHVSTAAAYSGLELRENCGLTTELQQNKIFSFQSLACGGNWENARNDFEEAVFARHPELARWKRRLARLGAKPALMTGSGAALFGLFRTRGETARALDVLGDDQAYQIALVSRARYRALWRRQLRAHMNDNPVWPPQSRYVR